MIKLFLIGAFVTLMIARIYPLRHHLFGRELAPQGAGCSVVSLGTLLYFCLVNFLPGELALLAGVLCLS
jgi:hypothetical protein